MAQRSELMIDATRRTIPEDHPIRNLFHTLTARGFAQMNLRDEDTIGYVTNLLIDFVDVKNMSPQQLHEIMSREMRRDYYRHVGDVTLFNLGLYPESLTHGR